MKPGPTRVGYLGYGNGNVGLTLENSAIFQINGSTNATGSITCSTIATTSSSNVTTSTGGSILSGSGYDHIAIDGDDIQRWSGNDKGTIYLNYYGGNVTIGSTGFTTTIRGTFTNSSDRNLKEDFALVNKQAILDQLLTLPLSTWKFKGGAERRHIGPMAQDFHAAFNHLLNLKSDDKTIAPLDEAGVAFAAIQALHEKISARDTQISALEKRIADLEARDKARDAKLAMIEKLLLANGKPAAQPVSLKKSTGGAE